MSHQPGEEFIPMAHARPDNKSEYSAIELTAIMHIPVSGEDVLSGPLSARWKYFRQMANNHLDQELPQSDNIVTDDILCLSILTRSILAEVEDPTPRED